MVELILNLPSHHGKSKFLWIEEWRLLPNTVYNITNLGAVSMNLVRTIRFFNLYVFPAHMLMRVIALDVEADRNVSSLPPNAHRL